MTTVEFVYVLIGCAVVICTVFITVTCSYVLFQSHKRNERIKEMETKLNSTQSLTDQQLPNSLLDRANSISKMTFAPNKRK